MKVLFLNPHVQNGHAIVKGLQAKGMAVLLPGNAQEAKQMLSLHGASLDLAIVHREDSPEKDNENGLALLTTLKTDPQYTDLPVIVTSQAWGDAEFARHQDSPQGANAYLRWPFDAAGLHALVQAVFGGAAGAAGALPSPDSGAGATRTSIRTEGSAPAAPPKASLPGKAPTKAAPPAKTPAPPKGKPTPPSAPASSDTGGLVLEDASNLFARGDRYERSDTSIRLEMPEPDPEPAAASPARAVEMSAPEPEAPSPAAAEIELGSSASLELSGALSLPEQPAVELPSSDGGIELPSASDSLELSLNSLPTAGSGGAPDALSSVLAQDASIEDILDAPADAPAAGTRTSVQAPPPPRLRPPRPQPQPEPEPEVSDSDAAQDMPYLFKKEQRGPSAAFSLPLGDAVVPGGAGQAPDVETLKKYLLLREQDVAVLSTQLKATKDQVKAMEDQLREERGRSSELNHITGEQKRKIDDFEKEKQQAIDSLQSEIAELRFQLKARADKARVLDSQVREAADEMERLKERVRTDIRKIRVREKELENKLEIMKKDSEALISARENKIIELKRKLDLLEFNMDLLQDQHAREKENASKLRERLAKAAQVVRVAGGLLDNPAGASQLAAALAGDEPGSPDSEGAA